SQIGGEIVLQSIGKMKRGFLGHILDALEQRLVAMPPNFHSAIEIGLRARHFEYTLGSERSLRSEDVRIRLEAHAGAAPVRRAASLLQLAFRLPALESHAVQLLLARHFDFHAF